MQTNKSFFFVGLNPNQIPEIVDLIVLEGNIKISLVANATKPIFIAFKESTFIGDSGTFPDILQKIKQSEKTQTFSKDDEIKFLEVLQKLYGHSRGVYQIERTRLAKVLFPERKDTTTYFPYRERFVRYPRFGRRPRIKR